MLKFIFTISIFVLIFANPANAWDDKYLENDFIIFKGEIWGSGLGASERIGFIYDTKPSQVPPHEITAFVEVYGRDNRVEQTHKLKCSVRINPSEASCQQVEPIPTDCRDTITFRQGYVRCAFSYSGTLRFENGAYTVHVMKGSLGKEEGQPGWWHGGGISNVLTNPIFENRL